MYERLPDWEQRLHDYLAANEGAVFSWGRLDCALFSAGAVLAITGVDPAADFRGHYRTRRGSACALGRFGQRTLLATVAARFPETPIGYARRGDQTVLQYNNKLYLGAGGSDFVAQYGVVRVVPVAVAD